MKSVVACRSRFIVAVTLLISGCASINTRPGNPDSYNTDYYKLLKEWPTALVDSEDKDQLPAAGSGTPVYGTAATPAKIWHARGYAYNRHLRYEAAAYKAQNLQDLLTVPVFGLAVATVATGIARASTAVIAGTGLGSAAAGGGLAYLHPDKDASTDQAAEAALLCVVDRSNVLSDVSAIPLVLDKAALQDALFQLHMDAGVLENNPRPLDPSAKSAIETVVSAAEAALQAVNAAIAQYVLLPSEIYETVDNIERTAKTAGARSLDVTSLLKTLQTSASNQSSTNQAMAQVQKASASAAANGTGAATKTPSKGVQDRSNFEQVSSEVSKATTSNVVPLATGSIAAIAVPPATASEAKQKALATTLKTSSISDISRVATLSKTALEDIPTPNFSDIAANIKACSVSQ